MGLPEQVAQLFLALPSQSVQVLLQFPNPALGAVDGVADGFDDIARCTLVVGWELEGIQVGAAGSALQDVRVGFRSRQPDDRPSRIVSQGQEHVRDARQAGLQAVQVGGRHEAQYRVHITRIAQGADIDIHIFDRLQLAENGLQLLQALAVLRELVACAANLPFDLLDRCAQPVDIDHRLVIGRRRLTFIDVQGLHHRLDAAFKRGVLSGCFLPGIGRTGGYARVITVGLVKHSISTENLGHSQQVLGRDDQLELRHLSWKQHVISSNSLVSLVVG